MEPTYDPTQSLHFQRMLELADEVFKVKEDPHQIDFSEEAVEQLTRIHSSTLKEAVRGDGPVAWVAVLPTTLQEMHAFLEGQINEKELLQRTSPEQSFGAVYLCSALVLPEWRRKGLAASLALEAIQEIATDHRIEALFYWPFTPEGDAAAVHIAEACGLPLYKSTKGNGVSSQVKVI
jgi:ribosomal protein S18 acetylase RimI-like enzyme